MQGVSLWAKLSNEPNATPNLARGSRFASKVFACVILAIGEVSRANRSRGFEPIGHNSATSSDFA
jgi:hypothetical protein